MQARAGGERTTTLGGAGGVCIGTVDGGALATVAGDGTVTPVDGAPTDWWVVAEDRVHHPIDEASTRQQRVEGTPVVETRVRVPGGDLAATAYAVAGREPLVVIELENRSNAAVAVAFSRPVSADRPLHAPPAGASLPDSSVLVPVGHRAAVRIAVASRGATTSVLAGLASPAQVVRGWLAQAAVGPRLVLPDDLAALVVPARCDAILGAPAGDDVHRLLAAGHRVTRNEHLDDDAVLELAGAVGRLARRHRRSGEVPWLDAAALDAAAVALAVAGEARAAGDVRSTIERLPAPAPLPADAPDASDPLAVLAWVTARVVRPARTGVELLAGVDRSWLGEPIEAHGVPTAFGSVGVAVRWHGERPALLWSCDRPVPLTCPVLDPTWRTSEVSGETLLAVPPPALVG